jgi:His/Glu/Gln/Arg/opine family amino acid ABC transporter permease subunit
VALRYNFNWPVIWRNSDKLYDGLALGLAIAVVALLAGCVIGIALAVCRNSRLRILRWPATAFVELLRNSPLLVLVFFIYFGLPELGFTAFDNIESFTATLAVYAGAYLTEVFRGGLQAIPAAYVEAGKAIGLGRWQRLRYVVLPVLFRIVLPSLSSALISLFKDTALAAAIGVPELTFGARWINVNTFQVLETWATATVLYLVACYAIAIGLRQVERRYAMVR